MKKITITEAREILEEILYDNPSVKHDLSKMSDKQLLKTNLRNDFELDSLDFEEMFETLYNFYGINVERHNPLVEYAFDKEQTVENFIEMVNDFGYDM